MHITETAAQRVPRRVAWLRVADDLRLAVGLVLLLRVGLGLIAVLALASVPSIIAKGDWPGLLIQGSGPWDLALSAWQDRKSVV